MHFFMSSRKNKYYQKNESCVLDHTSFFVNHIYINFPLKLPPHNLFKNLKYVCAAMFKKCGYGDCIISAGLLECKNLMTLLQAWPQHNEYFCSSVSPFRVRFPMEVNYTFISSHMFLSFFLSQSCN